VQSVLNQPADLYRRRARRIRGQHGGNPGELYRSLRDLSDRYDSTYGSSSDRAVFVRPATRADDFASQIVEKIRSGVLSYSDRLELLGEAEKHGIGRFDANLIIAGVQHRYASRAAPEPPQVNRKVSALDLFAAFVLVQVLILFLAWTVFIR
jgi:hypothetical protein